MNDDDFEIRPAKARRTARNPERMARTLVGQVRQQAMRSGYGSSNASARRGGTGRLGRGRRAALLAGRSKAGRRVVIAARIVRHHGAKFRAAPLALHIDYLARDGVSRDGHDADLFNERSDHADGVSFAARTEHDRHHFRFIVSPEDANELDSLRVFTRELMADMEHDLDTKLDWIAVDHWNTDNPHIHILVRGRADDGHDLVIDRDYIRAGMRGRAEEHATVELGPRSEREIDAALNREVDADRWTSLDRGLQRLADDRAGVLDLRPDRQDPDPNATRLLIGRAIKLERLGLADRIDSGRWLLKPDLEPTLRDLALRGDIIKTMHRACAEHAIALSPERIALHGVEVSDPIIGRLVERGLHDELQGNAYAIIDGADGRTHHIRFDTLEMTGDGPPGAIVELRAWDDAKGRTRLSLATRSDMTLDQQITAPGATWLDRQLVSRETIATGNGFGSEIRKAMERRADHLIAQGLARRVGEQVKFGKQLIDMLKGRDIDDAVAQIARRTGLSYQPSDVGDYVAGRFTERVTLSSGRFAVIEDGLGFQLVPWRPALEQHLGDRVTGTMMRGGGVDWELGRGRGLER